MADALRWEFTDSPQADDLGVVDAGLHLFNLTAADLAAVRPLACFARADSGEVIAACGRGSGARRSRCSSCGSTSGTVAAAWPPA